ncbi:Activator of basal transcription 1 [Trichuris trichiura]|uniref:Activator of basal transcription 1 n=1 Tax=Trichuris trichiura TaxID=36087 RepID=A0A077Z4Z5_TRITR|nr:Activator of basal transcription 1 [Trichuris trichiura]
MSANAATGTPSSALSSLYHRAYACIDQAIWFDEKGEDDMAVRMYEQGLAFITQAEQMSDSEKNPLVQKMLRAKEHVTTRLDFLRNKDRGNFERIPSTTALDAFEPCKDAELIFQISEGVQIFQVIGNETSVPSYPTCLQIFKWAGNRETNHTFRLVSYGQHDRLERGAFLQRYAKADETPKGKTVMSTDGEAVGFIKVNTWIYPLIPDESPVMETEYGAYMFPTCGQKEEGYTVGLVFSPEVSDDDKKKFESILRDMSLLRSEVTMPELTESERETLSKKIADFLVNKSLLLSHGIKEYTAKTSDIVEGKLSDFSARVTPSDHPVIIDTRVQTGVHFLRRGGKVAYKISGYLVEKVGEAARYLGKKLAHHATKRMKPGHLSNAVQSVAEVTTGGLVGFSTVWLSLEEAAKTLGKCVANNSVKVVECKYGQSAATLADNAFYLAGYSAQTAVNVHHFGVKSFATQAAKEVSRTLSEKKSVAKVPSSCADSESTKKKKKKHSEPGIVYLSTIPYCLTVQRVRELFSHYGEIGRIYFQREAVRKERGSISRYVEGWIEFKDKSVAKRVALSLNNTQVGGRKRSRAYESLWNIKYLHRFKWHHLTEQLVYEKSKHKQRMRMEISQAKREAQFFTQQIEKGAAIRKLEKEILQKDGRWERYQRQLRQRKPRKTVSSGDRSELLKQVFQ